MAGMAHREISSIRGHIPSEIGHILNRLTSWANAYMKRLNDHGSQALIEIYSENLPR